MHVISKFTTKKVPNWILSPPSNVSTHHPLTGSSLMLAHMHTQKIFHDKYKEKTNVRPKGTADK